MEGELDRERAVAAVRDGEDPERAGLAAVFYAAMDAWLAARGYMDDGVAEPSEEVMREAYEGVQPIVARWGGAMEDRTTATEDGITVGSGYGGASRRPFVSLSVEEGGREAQLRPALAIQIASQLIDAAGVAEGDAALMAWAGEKLELGPAAQVELLQDWRRFRIASRARDMEDAEPPVREAALVAARGVSGRL